MKKEKKEDEGLIRALIDMFSSNGVELKKVRKELRKKFNIDVSLNKLNKIHLEMKAKRESTDE